MKGRIIHFQKKFNGRKPGWKFNTKDLQHVLGSSRPTTFNFLNQIVKAGLVEEIGKQGRMRLFRKVNHATISTNDIIDSVIGTKVDAKMILVPEEHYKKLSESVVSLTKEIIEIKKQSVDFNWLQNLLGGLRAQGVKV